MKTIKLTRGFEAIVDEVDYERLTKTKWRYNFGYAITNFRNQKRTVFLHHYVIGKPDKGFYVDHINGNPLDNRKVNLRFCTASQNAMNTRKQKNCSSIYKGVSYHKSTKKYISYITVNRKKIHLGIFVNEIDAAKAYNDAATKYHGIYPKLNIIESNPSPNKSII